MCFISNMNKTLWKLEEEKGLYFMKDRRLEKDQKNF